MKKDKEGKHLGGEGMRPMVSWPSFSLSFSLFVCVLCWSCFTSCSFMVRLFGRLAAICPKLKHLKHLVFEVLVGDLGVEGFCGKTFWVEVVSFEKLEGEAFVKGLCVLPRRVVESVIMSMFERCFFSKVMIPP